MDITMDQINIAAIQEKLLKFINMPPGTHLSIEKVFAEKHNRSDLIHFSVLWRGESAFPANLVFKNTRSTGNEVLFYKAVQAIRDSLPVVSCLGCEYDPLTGQAQILLEDLTLTHSDVSDWPVPIPHQAGFALVEALAELHAAFWTEPSLDGQPVALPDNLRDEASFQSHIGYIKRDFEMYLTVMGPCLENSQCQIYREVLNILPDLWGSFWKPRLDYGALPLIHGDLNPRNILYPNHPSGKVVLIDWEAHRRGLPANDLAMLLGLHLCPEFEDALPFLLRYQQRLMQMGVSHYSLDDLLSDYEISLMFELFSPIKLYSQQGIQDECLIQNSLLALNSIREARF